MGDVSMMRYTFYDTISVTIQDQDWKFLCDHRFFSDHPQLEDVQAEFVSGTGITPNTPERWKEASKCFADYVAELRDIKKMDINSMARNLLSDEEKYATA